MFTSISITNIQIKIFPRFQSKTVDFLYRLSSNIDDCDGIVFLDANIYFRIKWVISSFIIAIHWLKHV